MTICETKKVNFYKNSDLCPICLKKFNKYLDLQNLVTPKKCNHIYHTNCLWTWFENNNTCPMCRAEAKRMSVFLTKQAYEEEIKNIDRMLDSFILIKEEQTNELKILKTKILKVLGAIIILITAGFIYKIFYSRYIN
jgi:hypothetical protein